MTLDKLKVGETARIVSLAMDGTLHRRMIDLGFTPNTRITAVNKGYGGYPVAYLVRGCVIAIREEEIKSINIDFYCE